MCCLFGILDYRHSLTTKGKNQLLSALATAAEARGTDATGIAYNSDGRLRIYKRPWPGHGMRFHVPGDAAVVMGHTRMTTQGNEKKNYNNHPFPGSVEGCRFALAHNGMLYNDKDLRRSLGLPKTKIETDSFIGVQLIEQNKALDFASLRYMAEQVEGSFAFTVLDEHDTVYIVRGDNPLCLYHFKRMGLYVYASTREILERALSHAYMIWDKPKPVQVECGDILRINSGGKISTEHFSTARLLSYRYFPYACSYYDDTDEVGTTLDEVKATAASLGYTSQAIDRLSAHGFSVEEIAEFLYA